MMINRTMSKRRNVSGFLACLSLFCCAEMTAQTPPKAAKGLEQVLLTDPTPTRSPVLLTPSMIPALAKPPSPSMGAKTP